MLSTVVSGALIGIDGLLVEVEVDVALGLPPVYDSRPGLRALSEKVRTGSARP